MGQAPGSGSFNAKVNTARMFGVLETSVGRYQLTELGFEIMDPARQSDAMVRAFLNVELFRRTYDEFRGKRLPPRPLGLERAFVNFGVAPKQAKTARVSFEKSARMAGFYHNGDEDRLVVPIGSGGNLAPLTGSENAEPVIAAAVGTAAGVGTARAASAPVAQPLEYQLIDLLKRKGITDEVGQAIWTIVRFLSADPADTAE
jgi:hypothetical protein